MSASHERIVTRLAIAVPLPALALALWLLWAGDHSTRFAVTMTLVVVGASVTLAVVLRERVVRPIMTLSNMLAAIREHDYSLRARHADPGDAMGLAMFEVNTLMAELRERRLDALDATALLQRVMAEIDVSVFAFDDSEALRVVNAAGERLLAQPRERLLGRSAAELGLADCLTGDVPRLAGARAERRERSMGGATRPVPSGGPPAPVRHARRRQSFAPRGGTTGMAAARARARPRNQQLDDADPLACAATAGMLRRDTAQDELREDLLRGLGVIATRSEGLSRFLSSYARLVRLPPPRTGPLDVASWVQRVVRLESRLDVTIVPGPPVTIVADGDQLDQLLINLVSNAVDATGATGSVSVTWATADGRLVVRVVDDGPGIADTSNLFVPFFTTKPGGTGIGLALSRQIAEAHGGSLSLANRHAGTGTEAMLVLPA